MEIKTFAESLRFKVDAPHAAIGTISGYFATFFAGKSGFTIVPYFTFLFDRDVSDEIRDEVRLTLKAYHVDVATEKDVLALAFTTPLAAFPPDAVEAVKTALERTVNVLSARGVKQPSVCGFCHLPGADGYHYKAGVHRPVHGLCLKEYLATEEPPSISADAVIDGESFVKSIVFGLLGGIIAALPAVLAAVVVPLLYPFLLALVPLGSFAGYRIGKGVVRPKAILFIGMYDEFLAFAVIVWCLNLSARAAGTTLFQYLANTLFASVVDAVIGMVMTAGGIFLVRRLLPVRKL